MIPLEGNDPIYISQLMTAYALLSMQGRQRVRIIFGMIFSDEDTWQKLNTLAEAEKSAPGHLASEAH